MPVTKQRPHVAELLRIAVEQQWKLQETRIDMLERPVSIWIARNMPEGFEKTWRTRLTTVSRFCEKVNTNSFVGYAKASCWPIGLAILITASSKHNQKADDSIIALDFLLNCLLLIESISQLAGLYIRLRIEAAFYREVDKLTTFMKCGFLDILIVILCFSFGLSEIGLWLRLVRLSLMVTLILDVFPHINVLMNSIGNGMKSIFFTILVLFVLILSYGVLAMSFFAKNDPFHFGNFSLAVLTFFQLSTFENWSVIYYINYYGCDSFPSEYDPGIYNSSATIGMSAPTTIHTSFGDFYLPECTNPERMPVVSSLIFCSYAMFSGYVIVSMCLAAVALGINEKLESLRSLTLYGEDQDDEPVSHWESHSGKVGTPVASNLKSNSNASNQMSGGKIAKLLGGHNESKELGMMLKKIWKDQGAGGDMLRGTSQMELSFHWSRHGIANWAKEFVKLNKFRVFMSMIIFGDALLRIATISMQNYSGLSDYDQALSDKLGEDSLMTVKVFHLVFQVIILVDVISHFLCYLDFPERLLKDYWTLFDFVVLVLLFLSYSHMSTTVGTENSFEWLSFFSIFRIVRVLKRLSFIADLVTILDAIGNSAAGLVYVALLIGLFFSYFGMAGVLLFREAAPFYFATLPVALRTLMQVMTLDNWSDIMRKCMVGCRHYGFATSYQNYDDSCYDNVSGDGVGYWAAIYFVLFIVLSSMVLSSLLIGVIITSMELLREGMRAEEEIWRKVRSVEKRYKIRGSSTDLLLELFDKLDKNLTGTLSFDELQPILGIVKMAPDAQFGFFMRVDTDRSGKIDFAEFMEMITLIGKESRGKMDDASARKVGGKIANGNRRNAFVGQDSLRIVMEERSETVKSPKPNGSIKRMLSSDALELSVSVSSKNAFAGKVAPTETAVEEETPLQTPPVPVAAEVTPGPDTFDVKVNNSPSKSGLLIVEDYHGEIEHQQEIALAKEGFIEEERKISDNKSRSKIYEAVENEEDASMHPSTMHAALEERSDIVTAKHFDIVSTISNKATETFMWYLKSFHPDDDF